MARAERAAATDAQRRGGHERDRVALRRHGRRRWQRGGQREAGRGRGAVAYRELRGGWAAPSRARSLWRCLLGAVTVQEGDTYTRHCVHFQFICASTLGAANKPRRDHSSPGAGIGPAADVLGQKSGPKSPCSSSVHGTHCEVGSVLYTGRGTKVVQSSKPVIVLMVYS